MQDVLDRLHAMERSASKSGDATDSTPPWRAILQRTTRADPGDMVRELKVLSSVPGPQVGRVAVSVAALAQPYGTPARMWQSLALATFPSALLTAVKAVWATCPPSAQACMSGEVCRLLDLIQQRHAYAVGGARMGCKVHALDKPIAAGA